MIIYPKDVEIIMGRSGQTARRLVRKMKKAFQKKQNQFITAEEFCIYTGIDEAVVFEFLAI